MNDYVLFIDSGLGGASVAKSFYRINNYNTLLVVDNKNAPLGNKTPEFLYQNLIKIISGVKCEYQIKAIVLACNTLSVNCYDKISKLLDIKVFTITPFLNVQEDALLLCTNATSLQISTTSNIKVLPMGNLATLIDNHLFESKEIINDYLVECLLPYKNYKSIILGCTHYDLVKDNIANILGGDIVFYDGRVETLRKLGLILPLNKSKFANLKILLTKHDKNFSKKLKKYFKLD